MACEACAEVTRALREGRTSGKSQCPGPHRATAHLRCRVPLQVTVALPGPPSPRLELCPYLVQPTGRCCPRGPGLNRRT